MSKVAKKIIILSFIALLLIGMIIYFIIIPTSRDIKNISQLVYNERFDLEKKYLRGQLLKKTLENFNEVKNKEEMLHEAFIKPNDELSFIQSLETAAKETKITQEIKLASGQAEKSTADLNKMPLTLSLTGVFPQIMEYIASLEKLNVYIVLSDINIKAASQVDLRRQGQVTAFLRGFVYQKIDLSK